ncbi:MAG: amidohydrolase family protein [Bryobacteraceae bacterium]
MNLRYAAIGFTLWLSAVASAQAADVKAFINARIIDGTGKAAIERGAVVVRDGRIEAAGAQATVPAGATRIDLAGKTIVPGLINAHGHVADTQGLRSGPEFYTEENLLRQLGLYARYGVTTVFSLGGDRAIGFRLRDRQETPGLAHTRLYLAGPIAAGKTPEEAVKVVDEAAAMKADIVKIRVDDNLGTSPKMRPEVYRAIIQRAHEKKLRVAAHLFYLDDARSLLEAGADFVVHSVRDREIDAETIALLKKRDVCVCPTLTREVSTFVYETKPAFFDDPFFLREADRQVLNQLQDAKRQEAMRTSKSAQRYKEALEVASRNLKKLVDSGVRIAFGTDTGPPARFQGYFEHMEMDLMAKAGLTPMQILKSATGDAARCMQVSGKIGTLEPGAWADLLVLEKNPLDDIRNMRTIQSVWIAGNRVERR